MIKQYLDESNTLLDKLIDQTKEDIEHIKKGNHKNVQLSVEAKNAFIAEFGKVKKKLDNALLAMSDGGSKDLALLLDDTDKEKLALFKQNLQKLHEINKEYAKLVLVVKDFFDELLNTMFENSNTGNNTYGDKQTAINPLFKMNV